MSAIASHITSLTIVYSIVYSDTDQRRHQSSASLAFVRGIHRDRWIPRKNGQLRGKGFHLMTSSCWPIVRCFGSLVWSSCCNKQPSCWRFEKPWALHDDNAMVFQSRPNSLIKQCSWWGPPFTGPSEYFWLRKLRTQQLVTTHCVVKVGWNMNHKWEWLSHFCPVPTTTNNTCVWYIIAPPTILKPRKVMHFMRNIT